jgi:hypothetical protein
VVVTVKYRITESEFIDIIGVHPLYRIEKKTLFGWRPCNKDEEFLDLTNAINVLCMYRRRADIAKKKWEPIQEYMEE